MKNNKYCTTKSGLEKLKSELEDREGRLRDKISFTLNEMRSQGDLRENDGYSMAVEEQHINEERIMELKDKIKNAEIINDKCKSIVGIGDTVILNGTQKEVKYEITSEEEANPFDGKVSHLSPIGQSVIGKKVGAKVDIETPNGVINYIIKGIE